MARLPRLTERAWPGGRGTARARGAGGAAPRPGLPRAGTERRRAALNCATHWLCFFPFWGFCVPIWSGLVVWYPVCTRIFNTPSLSLTGHRIETPRDDEPEGSGARAGEAAEAAEAPTPPPPGEPAVEEPPSDTASAPAAPAAAPRQGSLLGRRQVFAPPAPPPLCQVDTPRPSPRTNRTRRALTPY